MKQDSPIVSKLVTAGLLAIVILAPSQFGVEVMKKVHLSPVDPLIGITFLLWLFGVVRTGTWRTLQAPMIMPILFVALGALSLISSTNLLRSASEIIQFAEYFIAAYLLFVTTLTDRSTFRTVLHVFLAVAFVVIVLGFAQYWWPGIENFKVSATFNNSHVFGGFLSLMLPLFFGLMLYADGWKKRVAFLAVILAGVVATLSGGTFLALALAFGVIAMCRGWKVFASVAVLFFLLVFLAMPHLPRHNLDVLKNSVSLFNEDGDMSRRYIEWQAAVEMTQEHPLLGVGSGCYQDKIGTFYGVLPVVGGSAAQADSQNLYLVLAGSIGLPGLAAFLGLLVFGAVQAAKKMIGEEESSRKGLYLGLAGSLLAFSVNSIWSPLLVRGIGIPLVIVLAFATCRTAYTRSATRSPTSVVE
jgi:O-antigen ligase